MSNNVSGDYQPVFEVKRGETVESVHFGAAAAVDATGRLLAWHGNPQVVTYLRSSAKPLQALPFIELGGDQAFHLTSREIAILCASHDGTDEHVAVIQGIQSKIGVQESDLQCGVHPSYHVATGESLRARGELPTPNRNNCSGKHTGMLAHARMRGLPIGDYLNPEHPIQKAILAVFAEMTGLAPDAIQTGVDGCSAPNFAAPLYNAALGFARLCDPRGLSFERSNACRRITASMMAHPDMVSGAGNFDTRLMEVCSGRILSKAGAEGYQALGIMPGSLGPDSPGIGIVLKVADGDIAIRQADGSSRNRVRPAVGLSLLLQMGCLSEKDLAALAGFGPTRQVTNWRKLVTGESYPKFTLQRPA